MARVRAHHPGPDRALSSSGSLQGFLITPHLRPACLFRVALPPHPRTRAFPFLFHCICLPFSRQVASFDRHTNPTLRRLLVTAAITVPHNLSNSHHSFCVFDRQRHQLQSRQTFRFPRLYLHLPRGQTTGHVSDDTPFHSFHDVSCWPSFRIVALLSNNRGPPSHRDKRDRQYRPNIDPSHPSFIRALRTASA